MRGTFTFKPLKANLTHDTEWITKMDPYVSFTLGTQKFKSQICKSGGKNPTWNDSIQIPLDSDQQFCYLQLLDQDRLSKDDNIGTATIDLFEIMNNTNRFVSKWYPIFYNNKSAGEILLEIGFSPSGQNFGNQQFISGTQNISTGLGGQTGYGQQGFNQNVPLTGGLGTNIGQTGYTGTHIPLGSHGSVEDPLYGKTVEVKDVFTHTTGYHQSSNLGYGGSNLGYQQGTNLGYQQGTNLGYQQGTNLGQQGTGFVDNTLGRVGQKIDETLGRHGQGTNQNLNTNLNQNLNQNLGGQQFTQPGFH